MSVTSGYCQLLCGALCVCVRKVSSSRSTHNFTQFFFVIFTHDTRRMYGKKNKRFHNSIYSFVAKMQKNAKHLGNPLSSSLSLTAIYIWQTGDRSIFRNRPSHQHLSYNIYNNIACKSNPHRKYLRGRWSEPIVLSHSIVCVAQAEEKEAKKKIKKTTQIKTQQCIIW